MFILKFDDDYPIFLNNICANDRAPLEEIALSLYEEDMYEWFYIITQDPDREMTLLDMTNEAIARAKMDSYLYSIETITTLD